MSSDLFSKQALLYSQFRPQYPQALYEFLVSNCPSRELAWDCATGNGQAAHDLSKYFREVIATDLSEKQIQNAIPAENIFYQVLAAEQPLAQDDRSVDLITVAQAIHWFDLKEFYPEVKRVLKPHGVFAAWAYGFHSPITPEIDRLVREFYFQTLDGFWKDNVKLIWNEFRDLEFPFEPIPSPRFSIEVRWSLHTLIGYFRTWSATQLYIDKNQVDPTLELEAMLTPHWGNPTASRPLRWDLVLKAGRTTGPSGAR